MTTHKEPDIMDLELLTPGSTWLRENGKESRFLFITNQNLPGRLHETYPQMAVYADENNNIMSVPVSDFLKRRTFFNVDPGLESRLDDLLAFNSENEGADGELDLLGSSDEESLLIDDTTEGEETVALAAPLSIDDVVDTSVDPRNNMFPVEYFSEGTGLPEIISPQRLAVLTEGYQQQPLLNENTLLHTLYIGAAPDVTHEKLYACFSPTHVEKNAVYLFKVRLPDAVIEIDWDALIGIYPYVFRNQHTYQVVFSTNINLNISTVDDSQSDEDQIDFAITASNEDGNVISAVSTTVPSEAEKEWPVQVAEPVTAQQPFTVQAVPVAAPDFVVNVQSSI